MQNNAAQIDGLGERNFTIDTTFVLFFLAVDFGITLFSFGVDSLVSGFMLSILIFVPYLVYSSGEKPEFTDWMFGRIVIGVFAIGLGILFKQSLGVVLPEAFRFLPLTLLIVAAMIGCYLQFYSLLKFRLAK